MPSNTPSATSSRFNFYFILKCLASIAFFSLLLMCLAKPMFLVLSVAAATVGLLSAIIAPIVIAVALMTLISLTVSSLFNSVSTRITNRPFLTTTTPVWGNDIFGLNSLFYNNRYAHQHTHRHAYSAGVNHHTHDTGVNSHSAPTQHAHMASDYAENRHAHHAETNHHHHHTPH